MSVKIKELEVRAHIVREEKEEGISPKEKENIIKECMDRVFEVLKERNEQ